MIQDVIMAICSIAFGLALIPQIIQGFRTRTGPITLLTSIPSAGGLYICSVCAFTLGLHFTGAVWMVTATLWVLLLYQRIRYNNNSARSDFEQGNPKS
jgi:uncharacterized protein with PQ loop repeat